jgi:hypothetical protein
VPVQRAAQAAGADARPAAFAMVAWETSNKTSRRWLASAGDEGPAFLVSYASGRWLSRASGGSGARGGAFESRRAFPAPSLIGTPR